MSTAALRSTRDCFRARWMWIALVTSAWDVNVEMTVWHV
jgi:hypothetical protein